MKKTIKYISILIISIFCFTNSVDAKSYVKDLFQTSEKLKIEEKLEGTAFLAGTKVDIENDIEGIGFIAGETINISGNQEYIASAGYTVNIDGKIKNDAFVLGQDVKINGDIERDLYVFSTNSVLLEGTIERNTYIYSSIVDIKGTISGNITINAIEINIDENAIINGTIRYNEDAIINGLKENIKSKTYLNVVEDISFKEYITIFINDYIQIALLAIVLVFIIERVFKKSLDQIKEFNAKNVAMICAKGFLILIGVPIIAMMLLFSGLFTSVAIIGSIIYGILIYTSTIFTAYIICYKIDKKYFKKNMNSYLLMILGILLIKLLSIIPIFGTLISFVCLLFGLGISGNMIIELKK